MPRRAAEGGGKAVQRASSRGDSAFQVIILGSSGGPCEDDVTGLLVRSTATNWSKNSVVAVDAGILMSGIGRILERYTTIERDEKTKIERPTISGGPFVGLDIPNLTARANAAYIFREIIASILVTHPHLDHVSGLAMNTPAVEFQSGPKTVTALPSAIAALKNHVFNDITWPNLSDEDGGAGMITYQRLVDGGNMRLGRGEGKGYVKVCEGLVTKCMAVSHGSCKQRYNPETGKHHRAESAVFTTESVLLPSRRVSIDASELRTFSPAHYGNSGKDAALATVESSAFFIRDQLTGAEVIIFGDVEPDSISLEPRNAGVWEAAAPKIASGSLRAIFIECSYSDSVEDGSLYGHLCPRHLILELSALASKVLGCQKRRKESSESRKRKRRESAPGLPSELTEQPLSPKSLRPRKPSKSEAEIATSRPAKQDETKVQAQPASLEPESERISIEQPSPVDQVPPLHGLRIYIIHVKESLMDGASPREQILAELRERAEEAWLGCEFYAPSSGDGVFI
ncbi:3',5'-cyclic-nucleotide phosphodiesterase pde1 [Coccidioides posadasii str. Silveira]|uniref:cAMP-specific phosphodiesterase n=3 Tax=Coccidioides posadasii TaxID=199306 RepID=E9CY16_COCPS|nr:cAMP phosphodiesterases class-II family protein [Coccidioides posadasii C735 delta SOWgp]EER26736.1 cAMP phosphodiesterases class-II family protein [Coccidioides posadasii C735 delta SOWgp]EFW20843.1 cAMP-specific phosphodiesterase [Coccidioides posadasii str. Silveira]KMM72602.1 low-affinity cAMP phosphodiesterase [Coccidioides posadasii RMSCC 3488]QVM08156.1 3',5'-cyclic-nucleotide phosphodiesterase pde1 [Coccidioides posadasii str. Silveira]|eukprot:XP_003068881.1 cAMP phosphodiesterases class-II family protein [Coccidioides posadasii C735 delta SOWgp]